MDMHQEMDLQLFADAGTLVNAGGNYVNAYSGETSAFPEGGGMTALPAGAMALCRNGKLTLLPPEPPLGSMPLEPGENFWGEYTISVRKTTGNFSQKRESEIWRKQRLFSVSANQYLGLGPHWLSPVLS